MQNLPENWTLVEDYDGNFIYEDAYAEFQVSIDFTGQLKPPYSIYFNQLQGTFTTIGIEDGAYSTHAYEESQAQGKAYELMEFINSKRKLSIIE